MLYPPGFYYVKKPKRFVILSSDKSSERNLSCFFDIRKPRRMEHLQSEEPFSSDPYFSGITKIHCDKFYSNSVDLMKCLHLMQWSLYQQFKKRRDIQVSFNFAATQGPSIMQVYLMWNSMSVEKEIGIQFTQCKFYDRLY